MKTLRKILVTLVVSVSAGSLLGASRAAAETTSGPATRAQIQKTLGFVPAFLNEVPDNALPGAWQELEKLQMSQNTLLPGRVKELIGLAVAAQIPCRYCIYAHTEFAKLNGATRAQLGEAVAVSALARHWSTFFNGMRLDERRFQGDVQRIVAAAKAPQKPHAALPTPIAVVDAGSALLDVKQTFGFVPDFLAKFPKDALPGAWLELRDVEMNPNTAISSKYKSLIGLAVASQIPCKYCVMADTEFSKLAGASDGELAEAIAMAAVVRHWSTFLNGLMVDETVFRRDVDRLVANAKSQAQIAAARAESR